MPCRWWIVLKLDFWPFFAKFLLKRSREKTALTHHKILLTIENHWTSNSNQRLTWCDFVGKINFAKFCMKFSDKTPPKKTVKNDALEGVFLTTVNKPARYLINQGILTPCRRWNCRKTWNFWYFLPNFFAKRPPKGNSGKSPDAAEGQPDHWN